MSDHLKLQFNIEIYNQADMEFDARGKIISDSIKRLINERLLEFDFLYDGFFVSGGL
jgi:hypothetical protein